MKVKATRFGLTLCDLMDYTIHGILQARILERVAFPFSRGSSQPRDRTQVSRIEGDSLPAETQGKPRNTGVGSLSLLQWILLIQELNQGLLHSLPTELSGKLSDTEKGTLYVIPLAYPVQNLTPSWSAQECTPLSLTNPLA